MLACLQLCVYTGCVLCGCMHNACVTGLCRWLLCVCMSVYIVQGWDMETQHGNVCFSGLYVYMAVCWRVYMSLQAH